MMIESANSPRARDQVGRQHSQRRENHDRFWNREFEKFEVTHGILLNQSNSGESKLGTMMSSNNRGTNQ